MAEQKLLSVTISKVDGPIFDGVAVSVTVPGIAGEMTILAQHSPLISPLRAGNITVKKQDGTTEVFTAEFGTLEISKNHATILL